MRRRAPALPLLAIALLPLVTFARERDPLGDAVAAWGKGEREQALQALEGVEPGEIADHLALLRARWLAEQGAHAPALDAARAALALAPPPEVAARAHHEMARVHLAQQDLLGAYREQRSAWEASLDRDQQAAWVFELARAFDDAKLPGDALGLYRRLWQEWTLSRKSGEAVLRARQLEEATGAPPPALDAILTAADRLRDASRCEAALALYDHALAHPEVAQEGRRAVERGRARCLFQSRRYEEAAAAFEALAKLDRDDLEARIDAARCRARAGEPDVAVEQLAKIARRAQGVDRVRVRYLISVLVEDSDEARAAALLRKIEGQAIAREYAALARWQLAWQDVRNGRWEAAWQRLGPLARGSLSDAEVQRARYWHAIAGQRLGRAGALQLLEEMAEKIPLSYYGLLSADRLGRAPHWERSVVEGRPEGPRPLPARRAGRLLEASIRDQAGDELESWVRGGALDRAERLVAGELLHGAEHHFRAVQVVVDGFGGALEQGVDPAWREAWRLAWPRPFDEPVLRAIEEFDFDPDFVYAIMREESVYRPEVESPAGAIGLMQIIPPTASRIADNLGVVPFSTESLRDPRTNVRFGTYYLKNLLRRFDGSQPLAIAAYNAGPEAVSAWLTRDGQLAQDAFVESVPYGETRRYLRRVLRSYRVYKLLYPAAAAS